MLTSIHPIIRKALSVNQMNKFIKLTRIVHKTMPSVLNNVQYSSAAKLPHLPVPPLSKTIEKYLHSVKPFLDTDEFKESKDIVKAFEKGVGQKLQKLLEEKAKKVDNWLRDWWLDTAYLGYRDPVVIFSSPGQLFPIQNFVSSNDEKIVFAAKLIYAALDFKKQIDGNKIPQEKSGKDLLDMSQYKKVFGTCRIPGLKKDSLRYNPDSKYIVVVCNNHFFKVPMYNQNEIISECIIEDILSKIECEANCFEGVPIGALSSDNRDNWGKAYKELTSDPCNREAMKTIQNSLFLVCLDKPIEKAVNKLTQAGHQLIHGGGSNGNVSNRFFDKTMQFIISGDGIVGMSYEHSPSEGQPIAVLTDYIMDFITKDMQSKKTICAVESVEKITFETNSSTECHIQTALKNINKLVRDFDLYNFTFSSFGKDFVKTQKMSPDSFIQMAIQAAYYRLHKEPGSHYESAATRKYLYGRTETIRSCSVDSLDFAEKMLDKFATPQMKADALRKAVDSHKKYSLEAVNGFGVDRHLLGLKLIAQENNIEVSHIFNDKAFVRSRPAQISTSQVASRCDGLMCYGPLLHDGYACCYNPRTKTINFGLSTFKSSSKTSVQAFKEALECSLREMHDILVGVQKSKL